MNFVQVAPLSSETYAPTSVPAKSRFGFFRSSRTTCTKSAPPRGRPPAIDLNVRPPSMVTNAYGVKSPRRWLSYVT
jgi:hypothetical protein